MGQTEVRLLEGDDDSYAVLLTMTAIQIKQWGNDHNCGTFSKTSLWTEQNVNTIRDNTPLLKKKVEGKGMLLDLKKKKKEGCENQIQCTISPMDSGSERTKKHI